MPRGGRRPGAGRPKKGAAAHALDGSWRRGRHGPTSQTAAVVLPMPAPVEDWQPTPKELAALGPEGRQLLEVTLAMFHVTAFEGRQMLLALRPLALVEQLEAIVAREGLQVNSGPHPLLSAIARERQQFRLAWAGLRLEA